MPDFGKALRRLHSAPPPQRHLFQPPSAALLTIAQQLEFLKGKSGTVSNFRERVREDTLQDHALPGTEEITAFGRHLVIRKVYSADHYHGKVRLARFCSTELKRLMTLMREKGTAPDRDGILFLDTETTGMQGGAGICPFLVGVGYFSGDEFHMVQYFIRDFDEESSMLQSLAELVSRFRMVVTYNGRSFDIPLLETRFTLARMESPFAGMAHLDLLPGARRLWRNGHGSCRLVALEREIVSFVRGPDVPGSMIPRAYFDFLQFGPSPTLKSVFTHNVHDVVSLAALAVAACDCVTAEPAALDSPLDLYSLARVLENTAEWQRSVTLYEMALSVGLPAPLQVKAVENLIVVHRRSGAHERAFGLCRDLIDGQAFGRVFSMTAVEGAAIYYERIAGDRSSAIATIEHALSAFDETPENRRSRTLLRARWERLQQKAITFQ